MIEVILRLTIRAWENDILLSSLVFVSITYFLMGITMLKFTASASALNITGRPGVMET